MSKSFPIEKDGKPLSTPAKHPLAVPTKALADAIAKEWGGRKGFNAHAMPLTTLAFTAIDRTAPEMENAMEILLAYVDTDTLCYRSSTSPSLKGRGKNLTELQSEKWDPILAWSAKELGAIWRTTSGVMPLEQSQALHEAVREKLKPLDAMRLTACTMLASLYSSLILALAVMAGKLPADAAFELSRLEESFQQEQWGGDEAENARQERISEEIAAVSRFLRLLNDV